MLIDRRNGQNIFLGHGSGQKTSAQLKSKLAQEYNDVVNIALGIIRRTGRGSAAARAAAQTEMNTRFPNIRRVSGEWRVIGWLSLFGLASGASRPYYNQPLRIIRANEVVGPKDPTNLSRMYFVRRPVESRG